MPGIQGGLQPGERLLQPLVRDGHVAVLIQPQGRLVAVGRRQGVLQISGGKLCTVSFNQIIPTDFLDSDSEQHCNSETGPTV